MIINETESQITIILIIAVCGFFSGFLIDFFKLIFIKLKKYHLIYIFYNFLSYFCVFFVFYFINLYKNFGEFRFLSTFCFFLFFVLNRITVSKFLAKHIQKCYNKFKVGKGERKEKLVERP